MHLLDSSRLYDLLRSMTWSKLIIFQAQVQSISPLTLGFPVGPPLNKWQMISYDTSRNSIRVYALVLTS